MIYAVCERCIDDYAQGEMPLSSGGRRGIAEKSKIIVDKDR